MNQKNKLTSLNTFIDKEFGDSGSPARDTFEAGYQNFKIGYLIQEARMKRGLTQADLAERCGTTKSYISKIENDIKEVRLSTLQKIVEIGLGGELELKINL